MKHKKYRTILVEYLEGSLPETEMREVSLHLDECAACRGFALYLSETLSAMEGSLIKETDPYLYTRISAKMSRREDLATGKKGLERILQPVLITFLFVAAIFAGIEIGGIGRHTVADRYAMENIDPWLNELNTEPLETLLTEF